VNFLKNALLFSALCLLGQISTAQSQTRIHVEEAGVVLLNNYIPILLDRVGLTRNRQFINSAAQEKCVYLVHYIATDETQQSEGQTALSKVLCGLHPTESVNLDQNLSQNEISLINDLLRAVISYWLQLVRVQSQERIS
jgi:hypothetical protein